MTKYIIKYDTFLESKRNHQIDYNPSEDNIPDIYHGFVYLITDDKISKEDIKVNKIKTILRNKPDAMGTGEYVYQIKTKYPLKNNIVKFADWFGNIDKNEDTIDANKYSGEIIREPISQNIVALIKTDDIIKFELISGFNIYDKNLPDKSNVELSEETNRFLSSYIGGSIIHKKVTDQIEEELSQFKPKTPIKIYKGIEEVQLKHFTDVKKYEVGEKFTFTYPYYSSWTSNFLIAKSFIDQDPSSVPYVIESVIDPADILVDVRMLPNQYYHTDQREIIVKKNIKTKSKIIWVGNF